MRMLNWDAYRQQLSAAVPAIAKLNPGLIKGYSAMSAAKAADASLDDKMRELMALAVAVSLRCDGCIAVHTEAARKLGATTSELAEAMSVAISVSAGAAVVYAARALDAFDTFEDI